MTLLDGDGKIKVKNTIHDWNLLAQRAPFYFDIVSSGKSGKDYCNGVFYALYDVQPREKNPNAKDKLLSLLARVDATAPPIISFG